MRRAPVGTAAIATPRRSLGQPKRDWYAATPLTRDELLSSAQRDAAGAHLLVQLVFQTVLLVRTGARRRAEDRPAPSNCGGRPSGRPDASAVVVGQRLAAGLCA